MKKSSIIALNNYFNHNDDTIDLASIAAELAAEVAKMDEKSNAKKSVYEAAKPIVFNVMTYDKPMTVQEIYCNCNGLPEGFNVNKLQYALLRYWSTEVKKFDNGRNANTYVRI